MFIVDEKILTVMDSIAEEHECMGNACKTVTESSYSGIEPHEQPPSSSTEWAYGSIKSQKGIKRLMECEVSEKTHNQTKWVVKVWTELATSRNKKFLFDETLFSCEIEKLSAQLNWLCWLFWKFVGVIMGDIHQHHYYINCAVFFFPICMLLAKLKPISLSKLSFICFILLWIQKWSALIVLVSIPYFLT